MRIIVNMIGFALFLLILLPQFAPAQSLREVKLGSTDITVSNFCSFYARDRKFFEAEGLDMKMVIIKTEVALMAMAAGDLDYSTLSTSSVEGTLKGMPLRLLAVTNRYPLLGLVVRRGINSVGDLKGKKLSVSSFGGAVYGAALYLLRNNGLRPKEDVNILAGGTNSARIAGLKQGLVDAALITAPDDLRAVGDGYRILVDVGADYGLPWGGISASQNKIRKDPVEVEKFLRAVMRGVRAVADPQNKTDVVRWVGKFFKLDDRLAEEFYRRLVPSLNPTGLSDRDKIKLIIDSAVERGLTDKPLDPDAVVDFSIMKQLRF